MYHLENIIVLNLQSFSTLFSMTNPSINCVILQQDAVSTIRNGTLDNDNPKQNHVGKNLKLAACWRRLSENTLKPNHEYAQ